MAAASTFMPSLETAAQSLKVEPITTAVQTDAEIETAIIALGRELGGGLVVSQPVKETDALADERAWNC
jgi:hypothetical protein